MSKQGAISRRVEDRNCEGCPIRYQAFCARCDSAEIEQLERLKRYRDYRAGDVVVMGGFEMPFLASIVSGAATLDKTLEDGRNQMVGLLLPSDFMGNPGKATAQYTVTAVTELRLCCFGRKQFESLVETTPHIHRRMLEMKLSELDAARDWLLLLGRKTARERVSSLLAIIARRDATANARTCEGRLEVDLLLTRTTIADFLGLTLETVSRQMSRMREEGLLEFGTGRRVVIKDFERLFNETGDDSDGGPII